ncbi:hypothetical protein [Comamonas terrigena]|uniref:hypothetical protein n=1 Tax=Comamonas terrigena TaxID=32013 RepID=UPI000A94CC48|nr:hypothetical protein [Comamonas terrigena]BBL25610.1 hypothetical protein CT3_30650 [Comamonas terrigena NBRC 13299]SUY70822.1 Uncharacterised protein [Comamonas terrigena]
MSNWLIKFAIFFILIILGLYVINFYIILDFKLSPLPEVWGQLGDYLGGTLNPILSFISIVLLIKSLNIQNESNISLKNEIDNSRKTEKLKSFENLFFNLIEIQRKEFEKLNGGTILFGDAGISEASSFINKVENEVDRVLNIGGGVQGVRRVIDLMDDDDRIYDIFRGFFLSVKLVSDRLSEKNGFSSDDRNLYYSTLINFTSFPQLRLMMLVIQFMDYPSVDFFKKNKEFEKVINELGMNYNLFDC